MGREAVVPDPAKGSSTMSCGSENAMMSGAIAITGFCVGCRSFPV